MRAYILFGLILFLTCCFSDVQAQSCCGKKLEEGIIEYNKGNYSTARSNFQQGQKCSDVARNADCASLAEWIASCNQQLSQGVKLTCFRDLIAQGNKALDRGDVQHARDLYERAIQCGYISGYIEAKNKIIQCDAVLRNNMVKQCFETQLQLGIAAFNNGYYDQAKEFFVKSIDCGYKQGYVTAKDWYDQADARIQGNVCIELIGLKDLFGDVYDYTGDAIDGVPNGWGTARFQNGNSYEGNFSMGKRNGYGMFVWSYGNIYDGELSHDRITGRGVLKYANGDWYEGDVVDGRLMGRGAYYWTSGSRYEGDYVNGQRTGYGIYYFYNGAIYEGEFENGRYNGFGIYYIGEKGMVLNSPGCKKYVGEWRNNFKDGCGRCFDENGELLYDGLFSNDRPSVRYWIK